MMKFLGFSFGKQATDPYESTAVVAPVNDDSAVQFDGSAGFVSPYSSVFDFDSSVREEKQLIEKYRDLAKNVQEVTSAVEEICAEAIIVDDKSTPVVSINLDQVNGLSDDIKEMIAGSFENILNILNFHNQGFEIFKNWYVDGRIYYYVMIDNDAPENGIQDLRYIDPKRIKKVREVIRSPDNELGVNAIVDVKEYYIYSEMPFSEKMNGVTTGYTYGGAGQGNSAPVPMTDESIAYATSGLYDQNRNMVLSYLQTAVRPANNLRMMEDAMLIYRLTRAPERRVFYIDTGDIPASKREQYVQNIADKYRNKISYDATTGAIKNDKRYLSMTEDYWIPRPSNASGTEIDTLEGGQAVGETNDVEYFLDRLYTALHIPKSRFSDTPSMFSSGMEITRDEIRFNRFISRLRNRFSSLFQNLVGKDVVLRQIMTKEEWDQIKVNINFDYQEDNLFSESMKAQSLTQKINIMTMMEPFVGKYFSPEYIWKKVLDLTDEEIKELTAEIEQMDPKYLPMDVQMGQLQMAQMMAQTDVLQNPPETKEAVMEMLAEMQSNMVNFKTNQMFKKLGIRT